MFAIGAEHNPCLVQTRLVGLPVNCNSSVSFLCCKKVYRDCFVVCVCAGGGGGVNLTACVSVVIKDDNIKGHCIYTSRFL